MFKVTNFDSLMLLFKEIFNILKSSIPQVTEIWIEINEIKNFQNLNRFELNELLENFASISLKKGNYDYYIVVNKIPFIIEAIKLIDIDIREFSMIIDFNGFESLIAEIIKLNGFKTLKNYRFSDTSSFKTKTSQKRYEIDVIGIQKNMLLLIDAKQWKKKDSFSAMNKAGDLQLQRTLALKKNPDRILELFNKAKIKPKSNNLALLPFMVSLEQNFYKINKNNVPLVSIHQLNSFLHELSLNINHFQIIDVPLIKI